MKRGCLSLARVANPETGKIYSAWPRERQEGLVRNILSRLDECRTGAERSIPFAAWVAVAKKAASTVYQ